MQSIFVLDVKKQLASRFIYVDDDLSINNPEFEN